MKGTLTILFASATNVSSTREIDGPPALPDLQAMVGGYIQVVPHFTRFNGEPCVAFCNEDGKLSDDPKINAEANRFWFDQYPAIRGHDTLVGDIVIVTGDSELMEAL